MNAETQSRDPPLPLGAARIVDRICDAFEARWLSGSRPSLADHLCDTNDEVQPALLRELIAVELFYRHRLGEPLLPGEYLAQFPQLDAAWLADAISRQKAGSRELGAGRAFLPAPSSLPQAPCLLAGPAGNFGDYELLEEIAHGGMGVVYKARQVTLNRTVALKMILAGPRASPAEVDRFHAEAQAAAGLDHPGIVPIFEVGEIQGQHFFSMGFVEGQSLAGLLAKGPLPSRSAAQLVREVCDAVQYAHERQVIHRDLKPANILLDGEGRPRITDFGLAKCLSDDAGRTMTGQMMGTPSFIPPEQAAGKLDLIGPAADVYALGAILYALLTGRPPFQAASSIDTLRQVIDDDPLRPRDLAPGTPRDLETIALKCLQKSINQRYASARAMGDDLQRYLDGAPILARPVGSMERTWRWCRRNPILAGLATAVALLLVLIAAVSTVSAVKFREQLTRAEALQKAELTAKQEALVELWDSYLAAARARRMSRQPGQRFDSLRAIESAAALPTPPGHSKDELRTEAIAALMLSDLEKSRQWPGFLPGTSAIAIDPAFQRYARADSEGRVTVRNVADDAEILQLPGIGPCDRYNALAFSDRGGYLMQCCDISQGFERRIWKLQLPPTLLLSNRAEAYAFAPGGQRFATAAKDGAVQVFDLDSGKEVRRYQLAGFVPDRLEWNPKSSALFTAAANRRSYRLLNLDTGAFGPAVSTPFRIDSAEWHPEGRQLALVEQAPRRPKIHVVLAETGAAVLPPLEDHRTQGVFVRFNHYGDRLLSTDWSGLWHLWDVRTGQLLLTQPTGGTELQFSADDRMIGVDCDARGLRIYRFESGREFVKVVHGNVPTAAGFTDTDFGACQLDLEGRLLALPIVEGVALVDVVRGEEVGVLRLAGNYPIGVDRSGALLTHGKAGLLRWPMSRDVAGAPAFGSRRVYGPRQRLAPPVGQWPEGAAGDPDRRVIAFPDFNRGAIELLLPEGRQIRLGPQADVRHCAVSPDGRWVVTGSHEAGKEPGAKIWEAKTGRCVHDLPVTSYCRLAFSSDGKWLLTTGGGVRLWSVGDWREGPSLGGSATRGAFSASGEVLALADGPGVVRLVQVATGATLAVLTAPSTLRLNPLFFTRDGSRLVCHSDQDETLAIFDLCLIRAKLAAMGLDWEAPPSAAANGQLPPRLVVQILDAE